MKIAYLISGPRGSGKSTFVEKLQEEYPSLLVFNRDKFFNQEFGDAWLNPYEFPGFVRMEIVKQEIKNILQLNGENIKLIVDCWNGFPNERRYISYMLRELGFETINCLYFITPLIVCLKWIKEKPSCSAYSEQNIISDYSLYHREAEDILNPDFDDPWFDRGIFDFVYKINPAQLVLPGVKFCF